VKAITAIVLAGVGTMLAGCGSSATHAPGGPAQATQHDRSAAAEQSNPSSARGFAEFIAAKVKSTNVTQSSAYASMQFRDIAYYAIVYDAGSPDSFTAFAKVIQEMNVQPSSAASVDTTSDGPPIFTTPSEQERWQAAGKPSLSQAPSQGRLLSIPSGEFSFIPQGNTLTYQQTRSLPVSPRAISSEILTHLWPYAGANPPTTLMLTQLGFLLGTAPLANDVRSAAWTVLASTQGLYLCGNGTDLAGRHGQGLCVDTGQHETEILVDSGTASVLAVEDYLLKQSPSYPGVPNGSLIQSDTFISGT
jgi:hypothetical protein